MEAARARALFAKNEWSVPISWGNLTEAEGGSKVESEPNEVARRSGGVMLS